MIHSQDNNTLETLDKPKKKINASKMFNIEKDIEVDTSFQNGKIVEIAETEELLNNPIHPYTKRLISSIPIPDPSYKRERYEMNFDELDNIIQNNPNEKMVNIGSEHFVATHETKDFFIES